MEILVIDGQGGRIGQQLIKAILARYPQVEVTAIGTNSLATSAMLKGGASQGGHGRERPAGGLPPGGCDFGPPGHRHRRRPDGGDLPGHGGSGRAGPGPADSHPPEPV